MRSRKRTGRLEDEDRVCLCACVSRADFSPMIIDSAFERCEALASSSKCTVACLD